MLNRTIVGLLVAGPVLLACAGVAAAQDRELAPDCVQYSSDQGKITAVDKCDPRNPNRYFKSDIDRCKFIGRSETWATVDNNLYVCSQEEAAAPPPSGSAQ
ncbi:hypothetical protein D5S18_18870 [Nocardia panacis]|uniref:Uncharacterized protein n=1 Tax=Nocardia panacis TaxID=2340916 RepID=A0A3A4KD03_9NOCA|nr:hypothetical protein [Nocardia panacis]RJO73315.1 hypothetical protein D5S18_18870 [Nocardia panacis]